MERIDDDKVSLKTPLINDIEAKHDQIIDEGSSTSFLKTCFNGLNALSGVGILSIPYALASGGWLSLIFLFVIAIIAYYTGLLMQRCMKMDGNIRSYPDIGERAFGNKGRMIVSTFMSVELYLVATGFLILEGDNLQALFPDMGSDFFGLKIEPKQTFIILVGFVILPTVWLDNLRILAYISASGVLASAIILGSIFYSGEFSGVGFHGKGTELINWDGIPTAISLYAFCYCAHPVFPTIYSSMKKKHQFSNVLLVCFILCSFSYALMAILGYLMFGPDVQQQITLSLPMNKLSSKLVIYTVLVNPLSKYALMLTPILNATRSWAPYYCNKRAFGFLIGTSLVISTVIVALAVPFFGDLMSLVGSLLSMSASIVIPCLCYLKISGKYKKLEFETVVIATVAVLGVVVAIFGTYRSLLELVGKQGSIFH